MISKLLPGEFSHDRTRKVGKTYEEVKKAIDEISSRRMEGFLRELETLMRQGGAGRRRILASGNLGHSQQRDEKKEAETRVNGHALPLATRIGSGIRSLQLAHLESARRYIDSTRFKLDRGTSATIREPRRRVKDSPKLTK